MSILRRIVESEVATANGDVARGHRRAALRVLEAWQKEPGLRRAVSLRMLWDAFHDRPISLGRPGGGVMMMEGDSPELTASYIGQAREAAVVSSSFTVLVGNIVLGEVMEAYNTVGGMIGDRLVRVRNQRVPRDTIAGLQAIPEPKKIREGQDIPEVALDEKAVSPPEPEKSGLKIKLTREMVYFDKTQAVLDQARNVGEAIRYDREKEIIYTMADQTGYKQYYPRVNGETYQQTDVYRASGSQDAETWYKRHITQITDIFNNLSDLATCMTNFSGRTDEAGRKILVVPRQLVVPTTLALQAQKVLAQTSYQYGGVENGTYGPNREGGPSQTVILALLGVMPEVLTSPILEGISSAYWYFGDLQRCLVENVIWPLTVAEAPPEHPDNFNADIVSQWKATRKATTAWVTDAYVIRSTGGGS